MLIGTSSSSCNLRITPRVRHPGDDHAGPVPLQLCSQVYIVWMAAWVSRRGTASSLNSPPIIGADSLASRAASLVIVKWTVT